MRPNRYPYGGKKEPAMTKLDPKLIKALAVDASHIGSLMSKDGFISINLNNGTWDIQERSHQGQLEALYYENLGRVTAILADDMIAEKDPLTRCELIKGYIEVGHFLKDTGSIGPSL